MRPPAVRRRILSLAALALAAGLALYAYRPSLFVPIPRPDHESRVAPSSVIVDRRGQVLYEMIDPHSGLNHRVPLAEIPEALRQATIATEDVTFYRNAGFDVRGIVRALYQYVRYRRVISGGSTITQQLVRLLYLTPEERSSRTLWRKAREAILAYHVTRGLSKDAILELYLNEAYYGNMAYGVAAASRAYYGKPVTQLDLAECTMLAGLPQSPGLFSPLTDLPAAKARQRVVLDLMVRARFLEQDQADLAYREELHFASGAMAIRAPHFAMQVRQQLGDVLGEEAMRKGGLVIRTTLDLDLQTLAESAVGRQLAALNTPSDGRGSHNARNAAVLLLSVPDGAVRVLVGSPDFFDPTIDGAVNAVLALRQPGSALKPLTYAAAFERGWSPASVVSDVPTSFVTKEGESYVPMNYDRTFHGPVSLRRALACSYNVVAVRLLDAIGIASLPDMARRLGITSLDDPERYGLSLTLGGAEVSLWELTRAYAALASGGRQVHPFMITSIEDAAGRVLYRPAASAATRILDERVAYLVTDILADSQAREPAFGGGSPLDVGFPAAVKTGTTGEWRDNWTIGYTTQYALGVWVGNADNTPMSDVSGVTGAAPIWNAIMRGSQRVPPPAFVEPPGLVHVEVCPDSGQLPASACPYRKTEVFLPSSIPTARCTMHQYVALDAATGTPATPDTPAAQRILRRVTVWPAEAEEWARKAGLESGLQDALAWPDTSGTGREIANNLFPAAPREDLLALSSPDPNASLAISPSIPREYQRLRIAATVPASLRATPIVLYVDAQPHGVWREAPYEFWWMLEPGQHTFWVEAMDSARRRIASTPVQVTVRIDPGSERTVP